METSPLPDPPIIDAPAGSSKAAVAALDVADAPTETAAHADNSTTGARSGDSSTSEPRRAGPGPGRPKGTTKKISGEQYSVLKKEQLQGLMADRDRKIEQLEDKLANVQAGTAITQLQQQEIIDDSVREACAATVDLLAVGASTVFDLDIRIKISDREKLAGLWARVAKLQLGESAKHSPIAAAALATVAVGFDAYMDAKLRKASPVESVA